MTVQPLSRHALGEKIFLQQLSKCESYPFVHSFIDVCAQSGAGSGQNSSCSKYRKPIPPHTQTLRVQVCLCCFLTALPPGASLLLGVSSTGSKGTERLSTSLRELGRGRGSLGRRELQAPLGKRRPVPQDLTEHSWAGPHERPQSHTHAHASTGTCLHCCTYACTHTCTQDY